MPTHIKIASKAIEKFGIGPMAQELNVDYDRVRKWKSNGIAPYFVYKVHKLTGVPLNDLDPQLYPNELFK